MTPKEEFISIFKENITRPGSEKLLHWLEGSDFFIAPASTRFHGNHEGGLVEHSLNVYKCLLEELETVELKTQYTRETVAIVGLLHDICKTNFYKKGFRNVKENGTWVQKEIYEIEDKFPLGHAEKSVIMLQNFIKLDANEIYAIRAHMGAFDTAFKGGDQFINNIFNKCPLALLLHLSDMKATYIYEVNSNE